MGQYITGCVPYGLRPSQPSRALPPVGPRVRRTNRMVFGVCSPDCRYCRPAIPGEKMTIGHLVDFPSLEGTKWGAVINTVEYSEGGCRCTARLDKRKEEI